MKLRKRRARIRLTQTLGRVMVAGDPPTTYSIMAITLKYMMISNRKKRKLSNELESQYLSLR